MAAMRGWLLLSASLLHACSASSSGGSANAGGAGGSASGGTGATGGAGIDAALVDGSDAPSADECKNVDILFVIDDSASMGDNQQSLIDSFPGFVGAIKSQLAYADSYHVGVVTTDDYYQNQPACQKIGDLVTQTGGLESSQAVCAPFSSGKRYMDESEPDLAGKFACAAKVGSAGNDDERQMRALLNAIKPENNVPGACNDGFSRLDSLLVVVLITDEDDVPDVCGNNDPTPCGCKTCGSGGDKSSWYAEALAAKAGIAQNIVVVSLLGEKAGNACGAQIASKLIGFTNLFGENGYANDVCAASYAAYFAEALPIIDKACEKYVPPPVR